MPRLRKPVALLCVAVVLVAALLPVVVVFAATPLILVGDLNAAGDESRTPPLLAKGRPQTSLLALASSLHIARAALPARS